MNELTELCCLDDSLEYSINTHDDIKEQSETYLTTISSQSSLDILFDPQFNADYSLILKILSKSSDFCDEWEVLLTPYAVGQFDVCRNYIIISPEENRSFFGWRLRAQNNQALLYSFAESLDDSDFEIEWLAINSSVPGLTKAVAVNGRLLT